jgi:hypothetical protein
MVGSDPGAATVAMNRGRWFTTLVLVVAGAFMVAAGIWGLVAPRSFAQFAGFPYSRHFLHDAGAFQLGIGVTLLLASAWADAAAVVLAGFLVTNTVHTVNHIVDLDVGGHARDVRGTWWTRCTGRFRHRADGPTPAPVPCPRRPDRAAGPAPASRRNTRLTGTSPPPARRAPQASG